MNNLDIINSIEKSTRSFFDSSVGQVIDKALDETLKIILPDNIENEVINIKDTLLSEGLQEGIKDIADSMKNKAENIVNTVTGNFDKITMPEYIISEGGFLDSVSNVINKTLDTLENKKIMSEEIIEILKKGKDTIIEGITNEIENLYKKQIDSLEKINKYYDNWKEAYQKEDLEGMEKEYKKMTKEYKKINPTDSVQKQLKTVENINKLVKDNNSFDISEAELDLATKI